MSQGDSILPSNLGRLHAGEESLRQKALQLIASNERLQLHLSLIESAMELADVLRQFPTEDEDIKVVQILGMRTFNAFGASLKLAMSGYTQNSALIMRDILETVFLIDYFSGDRTKIERWRIADKGTRKREFSPLKVREALDARDGFTEKRRFAIYDLFSELAGHPNMKSVLMLRPQRDGDAFMGPFIETTTLEAGISEMGRLAVQVGEQLNLFIPTEWDIGIPSRLAFVKLKQRWISTFFPGREQPNSDATS